MSATIRYILPTNSKKDIIMDDGADTVACLVCNKSFLSQMALNNHVRMEHIDVYATGNKEEWTRYLQEIKPAVPIARTRRNRSPSPETEKAIKQKTEELVSSMEPTSLTALASEDVSYIIIKADPKDLSESSPMRRKKRQRNERESDGQKEVKSISGPFECLQPSNIVPDKVCHQIFFSCCEYSAHFRDEHTRRRKGLRCQVCEKPLPNPYGPDGLPYACDLCVNGFETSDQLEEHIAQAHVKHKPYACSVCGKRFTQKAGVYQHMRMHTGDKPYSCTFCSKSFTQKSGLGQHLRIHTKVRPYHCVICLKTFCQSVHLKQHMRTHTNVSPFQCGICQKRFKQSGHLNYHLKYHDPSSLTEEQKAKYSELIGLIGSGLNSMIEDDTQDAVEVIGRINSSMNSVDDETQDGEDDGEEAVENQEVVVISEVYESDEYVLSTEVTGGDWDCETEQ